MSARIEIVEVSDDYTAIYGWLPQKRLVARLELGTDGLWHARLQGPIGLSPMDLTPTDSLDKLARRFIVYFTEPKEQDE